MTILCDCGDKAEYACSRCNKNLCLGCAEDIKGLNMLFCNDCKKTALCPNCGKLTHYNFDHKQYLCVNKLCRENLNWNIKETLGLRIPGKDSIKKEIRRLQHLCQDWKMKLSFIKCCGKPCLDCQFKDTCHVWEY